MKLRDVVLPRPLGDGASGKATGRRGCRDRRPREPPKLAFAHFGEPLPRLSVTPAFTLFNTLKLIIIKYSFIHNPKSTIVEKKISFPQYDRFCGKLLRYIR